MDTRAIYATAYATANVNVAATQATNASDVEKTAYYAQGTVSPLPHTLVCYQLQGLLLLLLLLLPCIPQASVMSSASAKF